MKREHLYFAVLGVGVCLLVAIAIYNYWPERAEPLPPPAVVAERLATSTSTEEQIDAARDFIRHGQAARLEVRAALEQHEKYEPDVVAPLLQATAKNLDYRSMPTLIDLLEDPDPVVRGQAGVAVQKILGADFGFRAEAPEDERRRVIEMIKKDYAVAGPRLTEFYEQQRE